MKYLFLIMLSVISLFGCSPDPSGCSKDSDCKGNRICVDGECIIQSTSPAPTTTSTAPYPSGYSCGVIDINCNCNYTAAYVGQVVSSSLCQSGKHQFFQCSGSCGSGYPWGTVCVC